MAATEEVSFCSRYLPRCPVRSLEQTIAAIKSFLRKEQAGFRANLSCVVQFNTLHIILEQASEWQREVYPTFIDFEKAFDVLRWNSRRSST